MAVTPLARRRGWIALLATLALTLLAACGSSGGSTSSSAPSSSPIAYDGGTFTLAPRIAEKVANGDELNYVMTIGGTGIPIFSSSITGGFNAGVAADQDKLKISGKVIGPVDRDPPTQVSQVQTLLRANQIDCLMFQVNSAGYMTDTINQAIKAGVPVFGVNADDPDSKRIAFYALDEEKVAKDTVAATAKAIQDKGLDVSKAVLVTGQPDGAWAKARMNGFTEGMKESLPNVALVNSVSNPVNTGFDAAGVYSKVRAYLTGHPDVQLVLSTDQSIEVIGKVIKDLKLEGKVFTSGFNISDKILDYVASDQILVAAGQNYSTMGAAVVHGCTDLLKNGTAPNPAIQATDPLIVTSENVADARKALADGTA